jgi:diguanylate cyclase (GGDEF)-like protein
VPQRISSVEYTRLAALYRYGILDTPPDLAFDTILRDLAACLHVPVAQLAFADVQRFWAKSSVGPAAVENLRGGTLADVVILDKPTLLVADTEASDRPPGDLPTCELPLRSFAAIRLSSAGEDAIGLLYVADIQPRQFTAAEAAAIEAAAHRILTLLESRHRMQHDGETGALTAPAFQDSIRRMVGASRVGRQRISLVRLDLAAFRASLEQMGMGLGRIALRRMADIGLHQVRQRDCFGRTGLDTFAVLLTDTGEAGAQILADRLSKLLVQGWSGDVPNTGSINMEIATVKPQSGDDAETILLTAAAGRATPAPTDIPVARSA